MRAGKVSMEKVTVILSSFNHGDYIESSIQSILGQTYKDFKLIIIDDASTDNSWSAIMSIKDPRITAIRLEKNTYAGFFSEIDKYGNGDYIAVAHSDDTWIADKLEKQVAFLETHTNYAACFTHVQVIDENDNQLPDNESLYGKAFNQPNRDRHEWLNYFFYYGGGLCHPSLLIRRTSYERFGMRTYGLASIPDFVNWIRLCSHADIYVLQEKLSCFRLRKEGGNTSGDSYHVHCRNVTELFLILEEFIKNCNPKDMVNIFPQTQKYLIEDDMVMKFAYAQVLMENKNPKAYHLYGLMIIYNLMQDKELREKIEKCYGFTQRDFMFLTKEYDIFSVIPDERLMNCELYLDFGEGFSKENCWRKEKIYVNGNGEFNCSFDLEEILRGRIPINIRFDPDDKCFRIFSNMSVTIGADHVNCMAMGFFRTEQNKDIFLTIDSEYMIETTDNIGILMVSGMTQCRNIWDVDADFIRLQCQMNENKSESI